MRIIRTADAQITEYPDKDGNFRAITPSHPGFVGYGKSRDGAKENLGRTIGENEPASLGAEIAAKFMLLASDKQADVLAELQRLQKH